MLFLIACSSSNEADTHSESENHVSEVAVVEPYSEDKQQYVQSCLETSDESFCSCQFDVMNPILTNEIGDDWSKKSMDEKDFGKYMSAIESAVNQCG